MLSVIALFDAFGLSQIQRRKPNQSLPNQNLHFLKNFRLKALMKEVKSLVFYRMIIKIEIFKWQFFVIFGQSRFRRQKPNGWKPNWKNHQKEKTFSWELDQGIEPCSLAKNRDSLSRNFNTKCIFWHILNVMTEGYAAEKFSKKICLLWGWKN